MEPFGLFEALALWAVTIAAGVVGDADVTTGVTGILVASERCGATVFDAPEDNVLQGRESVAPSKLLTVLAEYLRDLDSRPCIRGDHGCPLSENLAAWRRENIERAQNALKMASADARVT